MIGTPLLLPLLCMVGGLASAHHLGIILPHYLLPWLLASALAACVLKRRIPFTVLLGALFFVWGSASLQPFLTPVLSSHHVAHCAESGPVVLEGVVGVRPEAAQGGMRLIIDVDRIIRGETYAPATGRLLVYVREGKGAFLTGDRVRLEAEIRRPSNFGLPGEFDYRRHLAYRYIYATASIKNANDILLIREAVAHPIQRWFDREAAQLGNFIGTSAPAEGGILRAILVGERGYVPDAAEELYTRAGINHILSISGFHVGVIALTITYLLLHLLARSEFLALHLNLHRTAILASLPVVVYYLFIAGLAPATVRSVVMIAIGTLALTLERETNILNTLTAAAFSMLLFAPQALFDISFQLSFLALWGIAVLTPLCMEPFAGIREGIAKKVLLFAAVSAAATLVTLLPVVHTFHRASVAGIIGNFAAVPLLGYGAVVTGFSALPLIHVFPEGADFLLGLAAWFVRATDRIIALVAHIPPLPVKEASIADLTILYLTLLALSLIKGMRFRYFLCAAATVLVFALRLPAGANSPAPLRITFFSVGQGESTLVTFPDGRQMLVDGGGSLREGGMDVGRQLLAPALWSMGVDKLDVVVLTHPHPDHVKGLVSLAELFPIGEFWESGEAEPVGDLGTLQTILTRNRVPVRRVTSETAPIVVGDALIELLGPPIRQPGEPEGDENNDSLVFRLSYGKFSMLFTGDIGFRAEERLLAKPEKLKCTVLKVPHHGSRHSSSPRFLDAASPSVALISAGVHNSFGLPSSETISRIQGRRVSVYRTDLNGAIEVTSNGDAFVVKTFSDGHFH